MGTGGRIPISFTGDESDLIASERRASGALDRFSRTASTKYASATSTAAKHTADLDSKTRRLGTALRSAVGFAVGAAAAYIGIAQAKDAISVTQDLAKATKSLHENLGLSVRESSQWAAVAQTRGVDSTKLGMAFKTLAGQITAARDGSASAVQSFDKLGFSQREINKGARDTNFLLGGVADGLKEMDDSADKAAISGRLFGRGWATVQPILRDGSKAMNEQLKLANQYGAAFGGKTLKSFGDLIAAQRELKMAQLGLQVQFTEHIAPALIDAGLWLAKFINQMRRGRGAGADFAEVVKDIGRVIRWLFNATKDVFNAIGAVLDKAGDAGDVFNKTMGKVFGQAGKSIKAFANIAVGAKNLVGKAFHGLGKGMVGIAKGISAAFRGVASVVRTVVRFIVGAVKKITDALGDIKDAVPDINLPSLPNISIPSIPGISFARGGPIPGQGEGDKVPAMLEPGEFVLNKRATSLFRPLIEDMNASVPRFGPTTITSSVAISGSPTRLQGGGGAVAGPGGSAGRGRSPKRKRRRKRDKDVLEELAMLMAEQNVQLRALRHLARTQKPLIAAAIADAASGGIAGKVSLARQTPTAGSLASY